MNNEFADIMSDLRGIYDIHLRLAGFKPRGPIFARRAMGDNHIDRHPEIKASE